MIALLIVLMFVSSIHGLEPKKGGTSAEVKHAVKKYFRDIEDVDSKYVINEALSNSVNHYLQGKVKVFPLFNIQLKIDKNPVRIPWILDPPGDGNKTAKGVFRKFRVLKLRTTTKSSKSNKTVK